MIPMAMGDDPPAVTAAEAFDDGQWFSDHPGRRYRIRPGTGGLLWVIRNRRRGVFLRAVITPPRDYPDTEDAAEAAWWAAVYPHETPEWRRKMAKAARRQTGAKASGVNG